MDLGRFFAVVWRFKALVAAGLALATLVALMSFVRIGLDGGKPAVEYRQNESWLTASTLLVTQKGFPWGRAILDEVVEAEGGDGNSGAPPTLIPRYGDPGRYSGLAAIYAELVKGDAVQKRAMVGAQPGEFYESSVVVQPGQTTALPMIYVKGYGPSADRAVSMAERASQAFIDYLDDQQAASGIPADKRIEVVVTQKATPPELFEKRSLVRPIMLFLLISIVFLAIAFGLENLRPAPSRREPEPAFDSLGEIEDLWSSEREREPLPARRSA